MNAPVPRRIVCFDRDDAGEWVAELDCGHRQHVLHDPPWQLRAWVVDDTARAARIGTMLECGRCAADARR